MWVIVGLNRWAMALPGSRKRPTDNGELLREERFYDSESHTRLQTHHPVDLYRKILSLFESGPFERADAFLNEIR